MHCFIPEGRIDEKNKFEKIDYRKFINAGKCVSCGNKTIDVGVVEDFVFHIEEKYGVTIKAIGFDRYNAISSAQKWSQKYNTVEIRQHSDTLHRQRNFYLKRLQTENLSMKKTRYLKLILKMHDVLMIPT